MTYGNLDFKTLSFVFESLIDMVEEKPSSEFGEALLALIRTPEFANAVEYLWSIDSATMRKLGELLKDAKEAAQ